MASQKQCFALKSTGRIVSKKVERDYTILMHFVLALLLLVLGGCSHSPQTASQKIDAGEDSKQELLAQSLRKQAIENYRRGEYLRTLQLFEAATLIDGNGNEARFLGLQYYSQLSLGMYDQALKTAQKLVKAYPYQAGSYQQVGIAQLWLGQRDEAARSFRKGFDLASHSPKLHFYFGLVQELTGRIEERDKAFKKAEQEYLQILSNNPKDFLSNYDLASLYLYWNQNLEKAEEYLKVAKKTEPDTEADVQGSALFAQFYFPVLDGILHFRRGAHADAEKMLLSALANAQTVLKADLAEVNFYLGLVKEAQNEGPSSQSYFAQSVLLDPKGPFSKVSEEKRRALASISNKGILKGAHPLLGR